MRNSNNFWLEVDVPGDTDKDGVTKAIEKELRADRDDIFFYKPNEELMVVAVKIGEWSQRDRLILHEVQNLLSTLDAEHNITTDDERTRFMYEPSKEVQEQLTQRILDQQSGVMTGEVHTSQSDR